MPRFRIKDLLIATTLIAIGTGMIALLYQIRREHRNFIDNGDGAILFLLFLWWGGGSAIGAGLLTPFKRSIEGAVVGFIVQVMLLSAPLFR